MDQKTILSLIEKYLNGTATTEEREILLDWYRREADQPATWEAFSAEDITRLKTRMLGQLKQHVRKHANRYRCFIAGGWQQPFWFWLPEVPGNVQDLPARYP